MKTFKQDDCNRNRIEIGASRRALDSTLQNLIERAGTGEKPRKCRADVAAAAAPKIVFREGDGCGRSALRSLVKYDGTADVYGRLQIPATAQHARH